MSLEIKVPRQAHHRRYATGKAMNNTYVASRNHVNTSTLDAREGDSYLRPRALFTIAAGTSGSNSDGFTNNVFTFSDFTDPDDSTIVAQPPYSGGDQVEIRIKDEGQDVKVQMGDETGFEGDYTLSFDSGAKSATAANRVSEPTAAGSTITFKRTVPATTRIYLTLYA